MTRPVEVLDHQADLIRWWRSEEGIRFGDLFGTPVTRSQSASLDNMPDLMKANFSKPGSFADYEVRRLNVSPTYRVEPEMCDLVTFASRSMKKQHLSFQDLPTPNGFAWLEKPYALTDVNGKDLMIKAICWHTEKIVWGTRRAATAAYPDDDHLGIWLTLYDDSEDQRSNIWSIHRQKKEQGIFDPRLSMIHTEPWSFETSFEQFSASAEALVAEGWDGDSVESSIAWRRWMAAFFALVQQKVPRTETHRGDRARARRFERDKIVLPNEVTVVTLRKTGYDRSEDPEPSDVHWTHRWWVGAAQGGFWQTFHTVDGPKQRWILPYVKGPADRPLVIKDSVLNWRR